MRTFTLALACALASPVAAQFTTAEAVRPILEATQANWVAVRLYEGQDYLYFTHLESWRCGLSAVVFGINGDLPAAIYDLAPCDEANPNAIPDGHLPFLIYEPGSIQSVTVQVIYDDGEVSELTFPRQAIEIP